VSLTDILTEIRQAPEHAPNFAVWRRLPAQPARFAPFDTRLDPRLVAALRRRGVEQPYTHQAAAIEAALAGENVVVVTPTASGKTLCYNIPVLDQILRDPAARAIYLFPTKALAQDQLAELHGLITEIGADIKTFTYDGDTPADARRAVRAAGHIVVTNPDMLHTGVLPHHTKWTRLFENLRYVVIDELHGYRGVFGSHVANVIRRLRRICRWYGSDPVFICCSATIANPRDLAERLTGAPMRLIDDNGAPRGERVVAVYNPPVVNRELGIRRGAMREVRRLAGRLIAGGVQTIVFAPSRVSVEILLTYLRRSVKQHPGEPQTVRGYRGGYLPLERREIERGLREGVVRGVVATNALELGIDIGGLEAAVLLGYPGSVASTRQQFGRAGRREGLAFALMVATSSPLNQYIAMHPEFVLEGAPEAALINPDNYHVIVSHLKCAAFELPFEADERFGAHGAETFDLLVEEEILHRAGQRYHWMAESYPAESISLRSASIDNFVVIEQGPTARVIGEVDRPSAPMLIHEEAIYFHGGRQYHVDRLDWAEKKAYVRPVDVDYYTDAELSVDLKVLDQFDEAPMAAARIAHGEVAVSALPTIFKKIKLDTHENVGWGKIHLPQEDTHTTAVWLALEPHSTAGFAGNRTGRPASTDVEGGLWGLGNLLVNIAPVFLMCDPRDVRVVTQVKSPFTGRPTVFLYETAPGGVGFAERLFTIRDELLSAARDLAAACVCEAGCPSCVGPQNEVAGNPKRAALTMLTALAGEASTPQPPPPMLGEGAPHSTTPERVSPPSMLGEGPEVGA
jgi:DEAD/DEAH box helicase domain-containing protein